MLRICSLFVLLCFGVPVYADVSGKVHVIDGDTLDVGGVRIRLHGIDAPEAGQTCVDDAGEAWRCGLWATQQVRAGYQDRYARCDAVERDRYNRVVATCWVNGRDIGRDLVRAGVATAFTKYSRAYESEETSAERARRGLHVGRFQSPSAFRKTGNAADQNAVANCRIKGNISSSGARIYHMPGQQFYHKTRINPSKGERCFKSVAEAREAGWRAARR